MSLLKLTRLRFILQAANLRRGHTFATGRLLSHLAGARTFENRPATSPPDRRWFSVEQPQQDNIDEATYIRICSETLDGLYEYFEELTENTQFALVGTDVAYDDGVLTVKLGSEFGTYVINRQTPNKQIWLSSPTSGPKRYDFVGPKGGAHGKWIYKHTGESLHELLQTELKVILKADNLQFNSLPFSG